VRAHLALCDLGAERLVDELDRVLDREDVARARLVDVVNHRGERRRLPVRGGARHDDEPPTAIREAPQDLRAPELGERRYARGHEPERGRDPRVLHEEARPESRDVLVGDREIEIELGGEPRTLGGRDELEQHLLELLGRHRSVAQDDDLAAHARERRLIHREVEIAPTALHQVFEDPVDRRHCSP
jgi:hypothetical protein